MLHILLDKTFRRLFAAQVFALLGAGLLVVALALLAYDIADDRAGQVLGIALTIKMLAYVGLSPVMAALLANANPRLVMVGANAVRMLVALALLFVDAAWQVYVLVFLLQAASATFTPAYQATIPEVLPEEEDYTRALSLSRLAYDLENLVSPTLAAILLSLFVPPALFVGTATGFLLSAALVSMAALPRRKRDRDRPFAERVARGTRIFLATPRLRGLLLLNVPVAAVGAVVIVQSVVVAQGAFGGDGRDLGILLGAYGFGSMVVALCLPALLDHVPDRTVMLPAGAALGLVMGALGAVVMASGWPGWQAMLAIWFALGAANAAVLTPAGRLLRRSAHAEDRPALFSAHFALSHACWLFAYPAAGFLGSGVGLGPAMILMGAAALAGTAFALFAWPTEDPAAIEHSHDNLPPDHPHLRDAVKRGGKWVHRHRFVIDDEHRAWPTSG